MAVAWLALERQPRARVESGPGAVEPEEGQSPVAHLDAGSPAASNRERLELAGLENSPQGDADATVFRIVELDGAAIPGAILHASPTAVTTADATGTALIRLRPVSEGSSYADVEVEANGYSGATVTVPVDTREVLVRLDRPVSILGRVSLPDGSAPGPGMVAMAWPFELTRIPPEAEYVDLLNGSRPAAARDRVRLAVVDPDGSFEIPGMAPSTHAYVIAGGPGRLSTVLEIATPGVEEVSLIAMHIYAAVVTFEDELGNPLELTPSLRASRRSSFWSENSVAEACELSVLGALLAGLPRTTGTDPDSRKTCLFASEVATSEVGPCAFEWRVPGYRAISLSFSATPIEIGATEVRVRIQEEGHGRGAVELVPTGVSERLASSQRDATRASPDLAKALLTLQGQAGGPKMVFGFELTLGGPMRIEDVPAGIYSARVDTMRQHAPFPPRGDPAQPLEIRAGETTTWTLDFSDYGALVVELVEGRPPRPYTEWARWTLAEGPALRRDDGEVVLQAPDPMTFVRAPYLSGLLPAGTYTLRGHAPSWGSPSDPDGTLPIQIAPQEVKHVRVELAGR